jgi:hypothetical protein
MDRGVEIATLRSQRLFWLTDFYSRYRMGTPGDNLRSANYSNRPLIEYPLKCGEDFEVGEVMVKSRFIFQVHLLYPL